VLEMLCFKGYILGRSAVLGGIYFGVEVLYWEGSILGCRCCTGRDLFWVVGVLLGGIYFRWEVLYCEGSILG